MNPKYLSYLRFYRLLQPFPEVDGFHRYSGDNRIEATVAHASSEQIGKFHTKKKKSCMGTTTHSIEVKAPLQLVYNQWTQFEEFPRFMKDVLEVRQHGPDALTWKVLIGGKEKVWEARIIEQIPDTSIVWESVDGTSNRGSVTFEPSGTDTTRLTVVMEYEPEGFLEKAGDALGVPSLEVEESLKSFKELIETNGAATGAWRGRIENDYLRASLVEGTHSEAAPSHMQGVGRGEEAAQAVPVAEVLQPSHANRESDMLVPPNELLENKRREHPRMIEDVETQPLGATASEKESFQNPHPAALQAMPLTETEAGELEAGMLGRPCDREAVDETQTDELRLETTMNNPSTTVRHNAPFAPDKEEIARRAFELYMARGQVPGHELQDWAEAERQLLEESDPAT